MLTGDICGPEASCRHAAAPRAPPRLRADFDICLAAAIHMFAGSEARAYMPALHMQLLCCERFCLGSRGSMGEPGIGTRLVAGAAR